jgi:hypothetical protein
MLQSEYDAEQRHKRLKILLIILTALMVAVVLFVTVRFGREYLSKPTDTMTGAPSKDADTPPKSFPEPKKTEFGDRFPTDFPSDIPVEKDTKLTQSYILDYPGQKPLSIVFPSMKTVKENYDLYRGFLEKQEWNISNKGEDTNLSFLYATKEGMEMNVTISEGMKDSGGGILSGSDPSKKKESVSPQSQVSVSVLRR